MIPAQILHRETIPQIDFDNLSRNLKDNRDTTELGIQVGKCQFEVDIQSPLDYLRRYQVWRCIPF
jgi:hypothetical protein